MKVLIILLFSVNFLIAQDSTFSHYEEKMIIDSVLFLGDTAHYEIWDNYHLAKIGYIDIFHVWNVRGDERICSYCLLWQKFHKENVAVYNYDPFYLAKQKALKLNK